MKSRDGALSIGRAQACQMLAKMGWTTPIIVKWDDDNQGTAYTDGQKFIALPREFCGIKLHAIRLTKRSTMLLRGLIAHEVCHFLQPLGKIRAECQVTGLNHGVSNIILDIHGETLIARCFPQYAKSLQFIRQLIRNKSGKKWLAAQKLRAKFIANGKIAPDQAFRSEAGALSMLARFSRPVHPYNPVSRVAHTSQGKQLVAKQPKAGTPIWAVEASYGTIPGPHDQLLTFYRAFATRFPELCDDSIKIPVVWPSGSNAGEVEAELDEAHEKAVELASESMRVQVLKGKRAKRNQPERESLLLAAKLRVQLARDQSVTKVVAPVNMNRRELAIGAVQPWTMDITKGKAVSRQIAICLDESGSIKPWMYEITVAAQAISIAVKLDGGSVSALRFGDTAYVGADDDDLPLYVTPKFQGGTEFTFLPYVWKKFRKSTVIIITDGDGDLPPVIRPEDRDRTHVIMIGGSCNPAAAAMIGHVHPCNNLSQLPKILVEISNQVR